MSGHVGAVEAASVHERLVANIRRILRRKRWSVNRLADFSGVARGFLSDVLNGRKSPTVRTLEKLADALCVEIRDLFGVSQPPGSPLDASATAPEARRAGRGGRGTAGHASRRQASTSRGSEGSKGECRKS